VARLTDHPPDRPVVVFDGGCGFCRFWITRWQRRTGDTVEYVASDDPSVERRFPEIPRERYAQAVQLIEPDGRVTEAAEAVFRLLAVSGPEWPRWIYEHVPGTTAASEVAYRLVADHRPFWAALTTLLWGLQAAPPTYAVARWLFLRILGLAYFSAFWSLSSQIVGLVGHDGILPADRYLADAERLLGPARFWNLPTLAWLNSSDTALRTLCIGGASLSALLVLGVLPWLVAPLLWAMYLSLSVVGGEFLSYQWDGLLLEIGVLAMFLTPVVTRERLNTLADPPRLAVRLVLWLLFRLMVSSGAVKLASGDATWHNLTALSVHFETQPIPTPLAWYAHWLPASLLQAATGGVLAIEMGAPLLMFLPRRLRQLGFSLLVGLQLLIALTGNYAFFNLLTVALCAFLVDDAVFARFNLRVAHEMAGPVGTMRRRLLGAVAVLTIPVSIVAFTRALGRDLPGAPLVGPLAYAIAPFRSVNSYGLFAVMTTTRPEIVLEGSDDGTTWREYAFKYKAGDLQRRPPWVAPHQPRLDWQMWFAALGDFESEPWFQQFCYKLLEGSPGNAEVLKLLERDPFEGRPPRYLRAVLYRYRFADPEARRREGVWWTRERLGPYSPTLSLRREVDIAR
jgi:predicted DCC family thiol-disulfide oxidoreductase YuxK